MDIFFSLLHILKPHALSENIPDCVYVWDLKRQANKEDRLNVVKGKAVSPYYKP